MVANAMKALTLFAHKCVRCGYGWSSRTEHPKCCARCKSYLWDKPYTERGKDSGESAGAPVGTTSTTAS